MSPATRRADAPAKSDTILRWIDARLNDAAEVLAGLGERLRPARAIVFAEQADGVLTGPGGACRIEDDACVFVGSAPDLRRADVEFRLSPGRCMFRELQLPAGAAEFLDGVVRAQLDRLTPWRAGEAAFGWSVSGAAGAESIGVTVAATKRRTVAALLDIAARSVVVTTVRDGATSPITLLSRRVGAASRRARWRMALNAALAVSLLLAAAAVAAESTLGAQWRERADALTAELAQRRAALMRRERAEDDPAAQALDARKRATPAAVVALEALSRAIPDDAYLTQMRVSGDKIEFAGVGADAAGLIKQIERSPHFSHATFTAPTTRGADDRETFQIEAHLASLNAVSP